MEKLKKDVFISANCQTPKNLVQKKQISSTKNNTICQANFLEIVDKKTQITKKRENIKLPIKTINKYPLVFEKSEEGVKL